jgi:hypothetical protein
MNETLATALILVTVVLTANVVMTKVITYFNRVRNTKAQH